MIRLGGRQDAQRAKGKELSAAADRTVADLVDCPDIRVG